MAGAFLLGIVLFQLGAALGSESHSHGADPFDSILKHFNITSEKFSLTDLNKIVEEFLEKFHCGEVTGNECDTSLCLDGSKIFTDLSFANDRIISEEDFEIIANILVHAAGQLPSKCKKSITIPTSEAEAKSKILNDLTGNSTAETITFEQFDEFLEAVNGSYDPHHGHEEGDHDHDHEEEHDHDEVEVEIEKCLSAGLIFDKIDLSTSKPYPATSIGHGSAYIVQKIIEGSDIKENCRKLPRAEHFLNELMEEIGTNGQISEHEFEALLKLLNLVQEGAADDHAGHNHRRRKREAGHAHTHAASCYSAKELLAIHELGTAIPKDSFNQICPSLIYQQTSKACQAATKAEETSNYTATEKYGYATLANTIICLCALTGILFKPCIGIPAYKIIMALFLGLASGTLMSDGFLHLIPMALGAHGHEAGHDHDHSSGPIVMEPYLQYSIMILIGVYAFYLLELIMGLFITKNTIHSHDVDFEGNAGPSSEKAQKNGSLDFNKSNVSLSYQDPHDKGLDGKKKPAIQPVAIMIIVGDAFHNFADGLAIGASFAHSVPAGVATSITVFCHELPHELGDFAILLASDMTIFRAAVFNLLSSASSFIGLYIGLAAGESTVARMWIFAAAAGMFLYIALVDMLPTLLHNNSKNKKRDALLNNIGIWVGFILLLIIALFEERIKI